MGEAGAAMLLATRLVVPARKLVREGSVQEGPRKTIKGKAIDLMQATIAQSAEEEVVDIPPALLEGFSVDALTDGFDMGVGALLPFVAKTDNERRVVINTVGPVWEGNQVWFILGGGAIFALFLASAPTGRRRGRFNRPHLNYAQPSRRPSQ